MKKDLHIRISVNSNHILVGVCLFLVVLVGVVSYFVTLAMSHHSDFALMSAFERIASWFVIVLVVIILIWVIYRKKWQTAARLCWNGIRTHVLRQTPVADLKILRTRIQSLGLALHGMTPEQERYRRMHFQMHGERVPTLVLPPQHASLHAEYMGLVKMLTHYGFPSVERVHMQPKTFAFVQAWSIDLESRLQSSNQDVLSQQQKTQQALAAILQLHQMIGQNYTVALSEPGYQRVHGAIKLLQRMAQDSSVSDDLVQDCAHRLQQDMETLVLELQQKKTV